MAKRSSYGNLEKIDKHPYFFRNEISQKITFRKSFNGFPVKISTGVTSISEAKKIVEERLLNLLSQNPEKEKRSRRGITHPLIKDVWEEIMAIKTPQRHKHTVIGYWKEWNHGIKPFWGNKTTFQITEQNVRLFENWYLETKGDRTFFNTHKYLTMIFRHCEKMGYIKPPRPVINDLDLVIRTRTKKEDVGRVYTDQEISEMLSEASPHCRMGILFGRYLGMRKMEVLSMEWRLIDLQNRTMRVWSMKNKKWREIPFPEWFASELENWREACGSQKWVFPARQIEGAHISSQMFDKAWKRAQRLAGIEGWDTKGRARFHDLRHSFATETAIKGWPVRTACEMLDMSIKEYQRTYTHVSAVNIEEIMNRTTKKPEGL